MRAVRFAFAAALALVLSACYPPTTSHPVGTTAGLQPDARLTGSWKGTADDGKPLYLHFLKQANGSFDILIAGSGSKAEDWNLARATTARLGANTFLNARLVSSNGKPEDGAPAGTMPLLYRIDTKGTLTLSLMDEKATKALIRAGKIKGDPGQGDNGDAAITADPKPLDAFMQSPAALATFVKPLFTLHKAD